MTIAAVVFDIGGILEITPDRGWARDWDATLGLGPGELGRRMDDAWRGGEIGTVTEAEVHQAAYGFEDLVDEIVYSHEYGLLKPNPRSYALICARLDVEPSSVVFLDDLQENVDGARRAGLHAVLYTDNAQAIGDIEALLGRNSTS